MKLNRALPSEIANPPQLFPWLELFKRAFQDLASDRPGPYAPIPWTARQHWAEAHHLDIVATELLHRHLVAMDIAFIKYLRDNAPKGGDENQRGGLARGNVRGVPQKNR